MMIIAHEIDRRQCFGFYHYYKPAVCFREGNRHTNSKNDVLTSFYKCPVLSLVSQRSVTNAEQNST